jgi:iron complex outermembrane receptor protein
LDIAPGTYTIKVSYAGLKEQEVSVTVPLVSDQPVEVFIKRRRERRRSYSENNKNQPFHCQYSYKNRNYISEELQEKGNMKPGDIRMMLNESTGIQTQQTSATSYNSSIRIQALDGKYTQIIRDGFPCIQVFQAVWVCCK